MKFLWAVTLLWAFSFSLIGHVLSGEVDGYVAVFARMSLAALLFSPFLLTQSIKNKQKFQLMAIGGIQIGLMYLFLYHSFIFLSVAEVLLFTIFTPLFVMLFDNLLSQQFKLRWFGPVVLGIIGAGAIRYHTVSEYFFLGFFLVQAANICFAIGQVCYRRLFHHQHFSYKHRAQHFSYFFLGALIVSGCSMFIFGNMNKLPETTIEIATLLWLGFIASGVGYLAWNIGATRVSVAQLSVMNNMLIPAGLIVELVLWQRPLIWAPFLIGATCISGSVWWATQQASVTRLKS